MKFLKRIGLSSLAILLFTGILTISSSAQITGRVSVGSRPAPRRIIITRPYYGGGFYRRGFYGGSYWGDPFWGGSYWNDPYYTNPRLRALADRVYNENQVLKSKKKIREYNQKFNEDGYISEKEQKKLDKAYRSYNKNVERLRNGE